jgi:hypothetical protein
MKTLIVAALAALTLVAVASPAQAQAGQYLSAGEAARVTGGALHREYTNIQVGSLSSRCPATRNPAFRRCIYIYYDHAGQCWSGAIGVRELAYRYVYRFLYDGRC